MSTVAPSGEISEGKTLSYEQAIKLFGGLESKLADTMSILKEVNIKLEQQDAYRKRAALLARQVALRKASVRKGEEDETKRKEEEEAKKKEADDRRKKLEELKNRLSEVKGKVEEAKKAREASLDAKGKGNVGEVKEEKTPLGAIASAEFPDYWKEIIGASDKFKSLGLLSG